MFIILIYQSGKEIESHNQSTKYDENLQYGGRD